jgi:hypothetical protein
LPDSAPLVPRGTIGPAERKQLERTKDSLLTRKQSVCRFLGQRPAMPEHLGAKCFKLVTWSQLSGRPFAWTAQSASIRALPFCENRKSMWPKRSARSSDPCSVATGKRGRMALQSSLPSVMLRTKWADILTTIGRFFSEYRKFRVAHSNTGGILFGVRNSWHSIC